MGRGSHVLDENGEPVRRPNKRIKRKVFWESCQTTDRKAAEAARRKKWREVNGMETVAEPEKHITLAELADLDEGWLRNRERAEGTIYLSRLSLYHLETVLKSQERKPHADAVTPQDVERFIAARRQTVGPKAINNDLGALRATYSRAVKHEILSVNPFANVEKLSVDPKPIRPLTKKEEAKLIEACGDDLELEAYVRLALDTGCRAGELSNLRVADLDLDDGLGRIECNTDWRSKTRRNRAIAYTPRTAATVCLWLEQRNGSRHVFREGSDKPRGHYKRIARRFQTAVKHAGIGRNVTLHDLRRTVGSLLAKRGINQRVAMEYLGHSNIATTAKFYQAVSPETLRGVAEKLRPTGSEG